MANHSYLKNTKYPMLPNDVDAALRRIVRTHFTGMFTVERWDDKQDELDAWTFFFTKTEGFQLWLNDERNLEAPHSYAWAAAFHWVQDVILCKLRERFGGKIYDDGVGFDEPLFADCDSKGIYPFREWWNRSHQHFDDGARQRIWAETVLGGPEDIMGLLRCGDEKHFDKN